MTSSTLSKALSMEMIKQYYKETGYIPWVDFLLQEVGQKKQLDRILQIPFEKKRTSQLTFSLHKEDAEALLPWMHIPTDTVHICFFGKNSGRSLLPYWDILRMWQNVHCTWQEDSKITKQNNYHSIFCSKKPLSSMEGVHYLIKEEIQSSISLHYYPGNKSIVGPYAREKVLGFIVLMNYRFQLYK